MQRWKQQTSAKCPRCDEEIEDGLHVWLCKGDGVEEVWEASIRKLRQWMTKQKTLPNLAAVVCDRLSAWRHESTPKVHVSPFLGLRDMIKAQDNAGWRCVLEGIPVTGWSEVQQRYYEWIGSRKTGERWLTAFIQKLWDVAWDLWEHRNSVAHHKEISQHFQQLQRAIAEEFELGPASVTQEARQLFRPGKESILAGNEAMQMAWLVRIQRARIRFQERLEERQAGYRAERQMMAGWLRRASG